MFLEFSINAFGMTPFLSLYITCIRNWFKLRLSRKRALCLYWHRKHGVALNPSNPSFKVQVFKVPGSKQIKFGGPTVFFFFFHYRNPVKKIIVVFFN